MFDCATKTLDGNPFFTSGTSTTNSLMGRKHRQSFKKCLEDNTYFFSETSIALLNTDYFKVNTELEKEYINKLGFSASMKEKAFRYMDLIVEKIDLKRYKEIKNPGISLFEDGLLIEWVLPHARLGLFFDPDDDSGSYYTYSDNHKNGISSSGPLIKRTDSLLVETFINQVESLNE